MSKWPFNVQPAAFRRNKVDITGWEPSLAQEILRTERAAAATLLRVDQAKVKNQPSAIKGELTLTPESAIITLNATQTESVGAPVTNPYNFIVRSGQQYDIAVNYGAPGIFLGRELHVVVQHRQFQTNSGLPFVQWRTLQTGSVQYAEGNTGDQTVKIADTVTDTTGSVLDRRFLNFFWNLEDVKSGRRCADDLMSHLHLRPQGLVQPSGLSAVVMAGTGFRFPVPWMVGPGGQLVFNFRPINDVVQLATTAGVQPYTNDQEAGVRNNAVRIRVEIHGTRYFFGEDNEDTARRMRGGV